MGDLVGLFVVRLLELLLEDVVGFVVCDLMCEESNDGSYFYDLLISLIFADLVQVVGLLCFILKK
ncbi:hypothetical protein, partial [Rhizobium brockwellii]|uniref:hypothetical protein n=1 Tax=Rhizobium brockwellii TaxID=3019932 RepID=UPI003F96B9C8